MDVVNLEERLSRFSIHRDPFQGPFVWHRHEAEEVHVLLFEPVSTLNTGNTVGPRTVARPERL